MSGWDFEGPVITNRDVNSQAAAHSVEPVAPTTRGAIWRLIRDHPGGLACWEVEELTAGLHQSVSASINWLHNRGAIERRGKNRTPTGRAAHIYHAIEYADRRVRTRVPVGTPVTVDGRKVGEVYEVEDVPTPKEPRCPLCNQALLDVRRHPLTADLLEGRCPTTKHGKQAVRA